MTSDVVFVFMLAPRMYGVAAYTSGTSVLSGALLGLIASPEVFAGVPCTMDALSEALRAVRVTSALFFSGEFSAPWRFATPSQARISPVLAPGTEHLVLFHLVTDGEASARTADRDDVTLDPGDLIVFPHGHAHDLWNGETTELFPSARLLPKLTKGELAAEKWGGSGPVTRIVCGYF